MIRLLKLTVKRIDMNRQRYSLLLLLPLLLFSCFNSQTEESIETKTETDSILIESSINLEMVTHINEVTFFDDEIVLVEPVDNYMVKLISRDYDFNEKWSCLIDAKYGYNTTVEQTPDGAFLFTKTGGNREQTDSANNVIKPQVGWTTLSKISNNGMALWHKVYDEAYSSYIRKDDKIILAGFKNIVHLDLSGEPIDTIENHFDGRKIDMCQILYCTNENELLLSYSDYSDGFEKFVSKVSDNGITHWESSLGNRSVFVDRENTSESRLRIYGGYKMERAYLANISVENGSIEEVDLPTDVGTLSLYGACNSSNGNSNYVGIGDTLVRSREGLHLFKFDKDMNLVKRQITGIGRGNWQGDMKYLGNGEFLCYTTDGYHDTVKTILFRTNMDDICYYDTLVNQLD